MEKIDQVCFGNRKPAQDKVLILLELSITKVSSSAAATNATMTSSFFFLSDHLTVFFILKEHFSSRPS